jgi:hypothetical protein
MAAVFKEVPLMVKLELSVSPVPATSVKVNVSPASGSVALRVPIVVPEAWFSLIALLLSVISVGA